MHALIVVAAVAMSGVPASDVRLRTPESNSTAVGPPPSVRVRAEPFDEAAAGPWEVWVALGGAYRPDSQSNGVTGRIGLNRKMGRFFRPELELGTGAYLGDAQTVSLMRLGTRFELVQGVLVPYLWAAFAHHHEMAFHHASENPFGAVLGLSGHGEIHRSGLDTGVGVTLNLPRPREERHQLRVGARVSVVHLLGEGPPRAVDLVLSAGTTF